MAVYALAVLIGLLVLGGSAFGQESALPVRYNATILQGDGQVCPPTDQRDAVRANISEDIRSLINTSVLPAIQGYGACGCGGLGWTRIAYLDMTDPTQQCPENWRLITETTEQKRTCGRMNNNIRSCDSVFFSNNGGLQYSQVCGRIISYQYGHTDAFSTASNDIDDIYVEGVSLTHGSPREHIWSFAAARDETRTNGQVCPCTNSANPTADFFIPDFVGEDYFCETGAPPGTAVPGNNPTFYLNDPIWDGEGCGPTSTCCALNNPPWFCKQLPQPTTDDLEARICCFTDFPSEDTPVELIEIYVK